VKSSPPVFLATKASKIKQFDQSSVETQIAQIKPNVQVSGPAKGTEAKKGS